MFVPRFAGGHANAYAQGESGFRVFRGLFHREYPGLYDLADLVALAHGYPRRGRYQQTPLWRRFDATEGAGVVDAKNGKLPVKGCSKHNFVVVATDVALKVDAPVLHVAAAVAQ